MAQANSNNSTTAPAVSTRRRFLSSAAGGAVAALAVGTAVHVTAIEAARPTAAAITGVGPAISQDADPIFAAMAEYRDAALVLAAAQNDYSARDKRLMSELGKMHPSIAVGAMRFHGPTPPRTPETVYSVKQLDGLVPPDEFPAINARYRADLEAQQREHDAILGNSERVSGEAYDAAQEAIYNLVTVLPTTMAGVLALLAFVTEMHEENNDLLDSDMMHLALTSISDALCNLTGVD